VGQQDFFASLARLTGQALPRDAAPDSFDMLSALLGDSRTGRDTIVEHARALSMRRGEWKMIEPSQGPSIEPHTNMELGTGPSPQLYQVSKDPHERHDLAAQFPEKVKELGALLDGVRSAGRSRP